MEDELVLEQQSQPAQESAEQAQTEAAEQQISEHSQEQSEQASPAEIAVAAENGASDNAAVEQGFDNDPSEKLSRLEELRQMGSQQGEMPFAVVAGEALTEIPKDLYIPPDALEVFLEAFEGPLDLLLYLIKRQNIDILDINVANITAQYMRYVDMMDAMQFELAAEYLLMAAMLAEIKSRMLLPRSEEATEDEDDPRAELIRRLQEYERFKKAAEDIDEMPRMGREIYQASSQPPDFKQTRPEPEVEMKELLLALGEVLRRADMFESHHVEKEKLSTRERMSQVLEMVSTETFTPFVSLFRAEEGRLGVVVTFLAIMELIKESLLELVQTEAFGPIHVKARAS